MEKSKPSKQEQVDSENELGPGFVAVVSTTFLTVFLAELGDKTQIATLLLSAQSGRPLIVFIGAAIALICSSLVGVVLGRLIANSLPPERFEYMAGALMVGLGCWLGFQATQSLIQNINQV